MPHLELYLITELHIPALGSNARKRYMNILSLSNNGLPGLQGLPGQSLSFPELFKLL